MKLVLANQLYRKQNGAWAEVDDRSTIDTAGKTFVKG